MVLETEPKLYADWRLIELLRRRKREGTLGRLELTQPLWLRKEIAAELGFNEGAEDFLLEPQLLKPQQVRGQPIYGRIPQPTLTAEPIITTPSFVPAKTPTRPSIIETPVAPQISLTGDFGLLYKEYQRTGGTLDVLDWGAAGAPLRPDMETEATKEGLQRFLNDMVKAGQVADVENILRAAQLPEEEIDRIVGIETRQRELETLASRVFPQYDLEGFVNLVDTDFDSFLDKMRTGGRTKEKQDLLRLMGLGWEDIGEIFRVQKIEAPVNGIRKLITWDTTENKAYDEQGKFVGIYSPITREIRRMTFGEQVRDFKDAWTLASVGAWERTKEFALTQIPKLLFRDMTSLERKIQGKEWADETDKWNREIRDAWRAKGAEEKQKYEDWVKSNRQLAPRPDYEQGPTVHPELWKDPWWWAYEVASVAPASVTALATGALATGLTGGNWIAGAAAAGATFYPQEVIGVRDDLLSEGIPEDQVDEIALIAGVPITLMESAGRLPLMWGVSPALKRIFRREAVKQVVRLTKRELVKRGIVTFSGNEFGETMTEVLQEAVGNAAVKLAGADRSLFENLDVIAAKTLAGVTPTSLFGGMGAMIRVSPSQTSGLTDTEMKAKAWVKDVKTGNWYEKAELPEEPTPVEAVPKAKVPEEITPTPAEPGVPEKVTPAPEKVAPAPGVTIKIQRAIDLAQQADRIATRTVAGARANYIQINRQAEKLYEQARAIAEKVLGRNIARWNEGIKNELEAKLTISRAEAVPPTAPAAPEGIPFMITRQQETQLRGLGYTQGDIDQMTPQQAQDILAKQPAPEVIEPDLIQQEADRLAKIQKSPEYKKAQAEWSASRDKYGLHAKETLALRGKLLSLTTPARIVKVPLEPAIPKAEPVTPTEPVIPKVTKGTWEIGQERSFSYDPNSTVNEGRFRLLSPDSVTDYFRRKSTTLGISYVMGKNALGKTVTQAIRFDKKVISESEARKWWEANKIRFPFAEKPPTPTAPAVTEPWQMTRAEWLQAVEKTRIDWTGSQGERGMGRATTAKGMRSGLEERLRLRYGISDRNVEGLVIPADHEQVIEKALSEGKPVPPEVLKDYPDLAKVTPTAPAVEIPKPARPTTGPYPQEVLEAFRQGQIRTAQDMRAHGGSISDIAKELNVSQQYVSELLAVKPAIPAEAAQTWTEAGLQPSMLPDKVAAIEVRPPVKGKITQISMDDQLKLEQAKQAAEEAPAETEEAYQAQWTKEALQAVHQVDPVAQWTTETTVTRRTKQPDGSFKLTEYKRKVGLDSFIPIGQTEFPDTLTVKQARMIWPSADYSRWLQKGTREYNKVPRDVALDPIASELGFTGSTAVNDLVARINQIRKENRQLQEASDTIKRGMTERPLPAVPELTSEEVTENWETIGKPKYTLKQSKALAGFFGDYVMSESTLDAYNLQRELSAKTRAGWVEYFKARMQDLHVAKGLSVEEAFNQWRREVKGQKIPLVEINYFNDMTNDLRQALFDVVYHNKELQKEQWEMVSTITALTNAIGDSSHRPKPISRKRGAGSVLFPEGGSAWDRLNFVFGEQPRVLKAIEKMADEGQSLNDVVEGMFHETGRAPIPIDPKDFEYLESLPTWAMQQSLGLDIPGEARVRFTYDPTGKLGLSLQGQQLQMGETGYRAYKSSIPEKTSAEDLRSVLELDLISNEVPEDVRGVVLGVFDKQGLDAAFDRLGIEMASSPQAIVRTKYLFDAPIEKLVKQNPLFPRPVTYNLVNFLKQMMWAPLDIMNVVRALVASVDQSFALRQLIWVAPRHPIRWYNGLVDSWKSIWNDSSYKALEKRLKQKEWFAIYSEGIAKGHGDFLRLSFVEEYGFISSQERFIPKMASKFPPIKMSERGFKGGINSALGGIFEDYYTIIKRESLKIASGQIKLGKNEVFDIEQQMFDQMDYLANVSGRASIGDHKAVAQILNALLFSARFKLGRILTPIHLIGLTKIGKQAHFNRRIMKEAWLDLAAMSSLIGGIIALGVLADWWETDLDPKSANFLKIRVGNMRIDLWGGYQQIGVFLFRLFNKRGISSITEAEYEITDLTDELVNFFEKSASPFSSLARDLYKGKTYRGEDLDFSEVDQWIDRVVPFTLQDMYEAFKESDVPPYIAVPVAGVLGWFGVGVQSYSGDWKKNWQKLGLSKYPENLPYGITEPFYTTKDFWADTAEQFIDVDISKLTKEKGFPDYVRAVVDAKRIQEHLSTLPSERLASLNADPTKGATFGELRDLWSQRQALVDAGDKAEFVENKLQPDGTYKKITYKGDKAVTAFDKHEFTFREVTIKGSQAYNGNFSQRQFALLNDYWLMTDKKKQATFLEEHKAEIGIKPRDEYLRTHPKENAQLAVFGQAKLLTKEVYNQFKPMVKGLDIPDNGLPKLTLPPETSLETHWTYQEMDNKGSWEAQLLLKQDALKAKTGKVQSYVDWRTKEGEPLKLSDTPIASLELKTIPLYHETWNKLKKEDDPDWVGNLDDKTKDKDGLTARDRAIAELKATKIGDVTWIDIDRKIEAIEKGTDEKPVPDNIVSAYVERGRLIDKEGVGPASAEVMLQRVDNPDFDKWLTDESIWGDDALKPIETEKLPIWRIDVKYRKEDGEYQAILDRYDETQIRQQTAAIDRYMADKENYRKDRRRRQAYQKGLTQWVEQYVEYYELPVAGYRQERFLVEHPEFAKAVGLKIPAKVPSERLDIILEQKTRSEADEFRIDAYKLYVPDEMVEDYVEYKTLPDGIYEDDWWMMEHPDFYKEVYLGILGNQRKDYRKVPSREIWAKYQHYGSLKFRADQDKYRLDNPDLDEWGVLKGIWTETMTEKRRRMSISGAERISAEIEERLRKLKEAVGSR